MRGQVNDARQDSEPGVWRRASQLEIEQRARLDTRANPQADAGGRDVQYVGRSPGLVGRRSRLELRRAVGGRFPFPAPLVAGRGGGAGYAKTLERQVIQLLGEKTADEPLAARLRGGVLDAGQDRRRQLTRRGGQVNA